MSFIPTDVRMLTHHLFLLALLVSFLEHKFVASKLIHNEDDIQVQYDYIIVGGKGV